MEVETATITLDGMIVYEGITPTSLGYVTVPFEKASGHAVTDSHLRITLTGPPIDRVRPMVLPRSRTNTTVQGQSGNPRPPCQP